MKTARHMQHPQPNGFTAVGQLELSVADHRTQHLEIGRSPSSLIAAAVVVAAAEVQVG